MAETLILTVPVVPPTMTRYKLVQLSFDVEGQAVTMTAKSDTDVVKIRAVYGAAAVALISTLNTANLPVKSLQRRVLEYMAAQGDFAGAVSGVPD